MSQIRKLFEHLKDFFIQDDTHERVRYGILESMRAVDIDRTEKLIALGEAALAKELALDAYQWRGMDEESEEKRTFYQRADEYEEALAALKVGT